MSRRRIAGTRAAAVVPAVLAVLLLPACGLPGDVPAERIDDDAVPYRLLDEEESATGATAGPSAGPAPLVFWQLGDRLVPAPIEASCTGEPADVVVQVLGALAAGPQEDERVGGRATAIPPDSELTLVSLRDGTAEVQLGTATAISAERLPVAVGQVTLTVTSAPGVSSVRLVDGGEPLPAPLPGGALTDDPVSAADYVSLIPTRFRPVAAAGCPEG